MPESPAPGHQPESRPVRDVADGYVSALAELDPILATALGLRPGEDRLPDLSPAGQDAMDDLARTALADLAGVTGHPGGEARRCARLLRERLEASLAVSAQGEPLRAVSNIFGPPHRVRSTFLDMPTASKDDWAAIARRMARVGQALAQYQACLTEGANRGMFASPRVLDTAAGQLQEWTAAAHGRGWFADFATAADVSPALRADLDQAAASANEGVGALARWLGTVYLPQAEGTPDGVGADRYRVGARRWTGADLEPQEAYDWGWSQFRELQKQMRAEAEQVLPGSSAQEAMRHLDQDGEAIEGVEEIPAWPDLAADARPDQVPAVEPDQHVVPRGRARPSPAARAMAVPVEGPVDVSDHGRRRERLQRGLGAVCRAADGRARLPVDTWRATWLSGRAEHAGDQGCDRHRDAPGTSGPR